MKARPIVAAHGKTPTLKGKEQLQWYEKGEEPPISRRQLDVIRCASHGMTYERTAQALHVSHGTVKYHWKMLRAKYPRPTLIQPYVVAKAIREGWIE